MAAKKRTARPWVPGELAVQRLVTATIELLGERRFSEVSTREIAARAGLYKQLITRHFGTIDGLFIEVVHAAALPASTARKPRWRQARSLWKCVLG